MHTILIVDDEPDMVRMLSGILERHGYQVTSAGSQDAALERLRNDAIDLVIIDRDLSRLNGRDVYDHIRSQPATSKLPVVIMGVIYVVRHVPH